MKRPALARATTAVAERDALEAPNLARGLAVLEYLTQHEGGCTLSELSAALSIATASAFRITKALVKLGYLVRDHQTRRFALSRKFLAIAQPHRQDHSLAECSIDAMRALRNATGETTQLACLVETDIVILDQLLATHPFKYSADLGARCPIYSCAPGKAITAWLPPADREALVSRLRYKRFTPTTIGSRIEMQRELDLIRAAGFAVDRGEGLPGVHCVAAPIFDRHGVAIAAITIAGPASRILEKNFPTIGKRVMEAAAAASQRFAG